MKFKVSELGVRLYSFGYYCVLMAFLIQVSSAPNKYAFLYSVIRNLRIIGYAACVLKILIGNAFTVKNIFRYLFASVLILIVTFRTDSITFLTDILFIIACKNVSLTRIIKLDLKVRCIVLAILVLLSLSGVITDVLDYRDGVLSRHSLGFAHPNRFALHVLMICMYYFYIHYNRLKLRHIVFLTCAGLFAFIASDGRTSFIATLLLVIIAIIKKLELTGGNKKFIEQHARGVSVAIVLTSLSFSALSPFLLLRDIPAFNVNNTFTSRILSAALALRNNGITMFGQRLEFIGTIAARLAGNKVANAVDNAYVYVLVNYGLLMFCFLIIIIIAGIRYSIRKNDYAGLICFSILILVGIMENQMLNIEANLFLLYIGMAWNDTVAERRTIKYHYRDMEV